MTHESAFKYNIVFAPTFCAEAGTDIGKSGSKFKPRCHDEVFCMSHLYAYCMPECVPRQGSCSMYSKLKEKVCDLPEDI